MHLGPTPDRHHRPAWSVGVLKIGRSQYCLCFHYDDTGNNVRLPDGVYCFYYDDHKDVIPIIFSMYQNT